MRVNRGDQTYSILVLFKHKLSSLWSRTLSPCNTVYVQTQGFLWVGKDCGITAWMLSSFIISTTSKHHLMLQEGSLINVINTILPSMWGSRCARPEVPQAPADTEEGRDTLGNRATPAGRQPGSVDRFPALLPGGLQSHVNCRSDSLSLAGVTSSASVRNILLGEGNDKVFPVEISKPNSGNLCYSHITRSQTDPSVLTPEKSSSNMFLLHCSLFVFTTEQSNLANESKGNWSDLVLFWLGCLQVLVTARRKIP